MQLISSRKFVYLFVDTRSKIDRSHNSLFQRRVKDVGFEDFDLLTKTVITLKKKSFVDLLPALLHHVTC